MIHGCAEHETPDSRKAWNFNQTLMQRIEVLKMQQRVCELFSVSPEVTEKRAEPERFNIVTEWQGGLASESVCRDAYDKDSHAFAVYADEPHVLGGQVVFPHPQSLLLAAFNPCMIATLVTEAEKANISFTLLKIETRSELASVIAEQRIPHSLQAQMQYVITVSNASSVAQFDALYQLGIAHSLNRWILASSW